MHLFQAPAVALVFNLWQLQMRCEQIVKGLQRADVLARLVVYIVSGAVQVIRALLLHAGPYVLVKYF